ncbi:MAG: PKD domain-containing protein [Phycisphaerae bacterium]|nr:PKD domain-containing protein [Phycisphaerae bacterium]
MRRPRLFILLGLTAPLLLVSLNLGGCNLLEPTTGGVILFNLPPTVILTAIPDPPRGVSPLMVQFNSSDSTDDGVIVNRVWDFGDGDTSQDISPLHIFETNGEYTVQLTLTDDDGASATGKLTIIVTERPVAEFTVTYLPDDPAANPVPGRVTADVAPATFEFDGTASYDPDAEEGDRLLYSWDFGDGAQEKFATVPHTFATPGTYRVTLTVTDATGVVGTSEKIISIGIPRPEITFRSPPDDVRDMVCSADSPLWVQIVFDVEPGIPYTIRAGLDPDRDPASADDIQLDEDATDNVLVNDLNLTVPTALDLPADIATGTYGLWVELATDRTTPTRIYAEADIHVVSAFTTEIGGTTAPPLLPVLNYTNPAWAVVMPPTSGTQIFELGRLNSGDRLFLSLLTTPGYSATYTQEGYSLLILDDQLEMYAWYDDSLVLFSPNSKLVIGGNRPRYYMVLNAPAPALVPSVSIRVQTDPATIVPSRTQYIYLDFTAAGSISVAGSALFDVPDFYLKGAPNDDLIMDNVRARVESRLGPYNFVVVTSTPNNPVAAPTQPHNTIYFDTSGLVSVTGNLLSVIPDRNGDGVGNAGDLQCFGLSSYLDPRNDTLTGRAAVDVAYLDAYFTAYRASLFPAQPPLSDKELAVAISNAVLHQIGFLSGLRETTGTLDGAAVNDVMTSNITAADNTALDFVTADLADTDVGRQNAPAFLGDVFRN